jgi:inhibitor of cysteine peptidase
MKKISPFLVLTVILILAIPLTSCTNEVTAHSDPDKTIDIKTSKEFVILIALESNHTTGYSWRTSFDSTALELVEQTYELGEYVKENIVGAGGTELFRFKALKTDSYHIIFDYQRPWEDESIDTKTFIVEIK